MKRCAQPNDISKYMDLKHESWLYIQKSINKPTCDSEISIVNKWMFECFNTFS